MTLAKEGDFELLNETDWIIVEKELKDTLNKGFQVCCPNCHSTDYEIYPTGQMGMVITRPEEDLHWVCKSCGYIWNSEFLAKRYNYCKSMYVGRFDQRYVKKENINK